MDRLELDENERVVLLAALENLSTATVTGANDLTEDEVEEAIERLMERAG